MIKLAILGSTGSIGQSTLEVVRSLPGRFKVVALSAQADIVKLKQQIDEFRPRLVCVADVFSAGKLSAQLGTKVKVLVGQQGLTELVAQKDITQVMVAITGSAALVPLVSAIKSGKDIALANKEALVMAGALLMRLAKQHKVLIKPVDSEQSAIWQCLAGFDGASVRRVYLTASGGPLWNLPRAKFKQLTVAKVLQHPRWSMGKKITVDSATLMNKGLELLEAMFLFNLSVDKIKVLIHPEALIHSMVEFNDAVTLAQLSITDMRVPIQYALTYPQRLVNRLPGVDFYALGELHFSKPDFVKFPCLALAHQAAADLGSMPTVLNAANEMAVERFLAGKLNFTAIPKVVEKVMRQHRLLGQPTLTQILQTDAWARAQAVGILGRFN